MPILQPTPLVSPPTLVPTVAVHRRRSSSSPVPETEEDEKQGESRLRGLDVLWAMQKAAAEKNKVKIRKKNKFPSSSSAVGQMKLQEMPDYGNVKPLCVKREWGVKLDELERRLRQLNE
ncbi:hypothetical protein LINPERPRIM_LOCUS27711 [Linum perenne]